MSENQDPNIPPSSNVPPPGNVPPPPPVPPSEPAPLNYAAPTKGPAYLGPAPDKDARLWGMLAHLAVLAGYIIPFGNILGPLVVWLIKKQEMPFVDDQGKESLNFQITVTIALIICVPLICIVIGVPLMIIIGLADLVLIIIAGVKANSGVAYRYPWTLRLIK